VKYLKYHIRNNVIHTAVIEYVEIHWHIDQNLGPYVVLTEEDPEPSSLNPGRLSLTPKTWDGFTHIRMVLIFQTRERVNGKDLDRVHFRFADIREAVIDEASKPSVLARNVLDFLQ
jgi:hypothetical protein